MLPSAMTPSHPARARSRCIAGTLRQGLLRLRNASSSWFYVACGGSKTSLKHRKEPRTLRLETGKEGVGRDRVERAIRCHQFERASALGDASRGKVSGRTLERMRGDADRIRLPGSDGGPDLSQPCRTVDEEHLRHLGDQLMAAQASPQLFHAQGRGARREACVPAIAGRLSQLDGGEERARID